MRRLVVLCFTAAGLVLAAPAGAAPRAYTYEPIAWMGGPAPGGGMLAGYLAPKAINASGEVAFEAGVSDGSDGVFTGTPAGLDVVARTGFPAPGGPFSGVSWGKAGLNNSGEVGLRLRRPGHRASDPSTGRTPGAGRPSSIAAAGRCPAGRRDARRRSRASRRRSTCTATWPSTP